MRARKRTPTGLSLSFRFLTWGICFSFNICTTEFVSPPAFTPDCQPYGGLFSSRLITNEIAPRTLLDAFNPQLAARSHPRRRLQWSSTWSRTAVGYEFPPVIWFRTFQREMKGSPGEPEPLGASESDGSKFVAVFFQGNTHQLASRPYAGFCEEMLETTLDGTF